MDDAHMTLDSVDPFERAVMRMVAMNRRKRKDYASANNQFLNFEVNAAMMRLEGYTREEDCLSMVCRKINRITNLRGREAANESVVDSYEDLAVYAALLFAMALENASQEVVGIKTETTQGVNPDVALGHEMVTMPVERVSPLQEEVVNLLDDCDQPGHTNCSIYLPTMQHLQGAERQAWIVNKMSELGSLRKRQLVDYADPENGQK